MSMSNFSAFALTRSEMKNVIGGSCGVKINGSWYQVGSKAEAKGNLGQTGTWSYTDGSGNKVSGTVTNWCCDSCYWN